MRVSLLWDFRIEHGVFLSLLLVFVDQTQLLALALFLVES